MFARLDSRGVGFTITARLLFSTVILVVAAGASTAPQWSEPFRAKPSSIGGEQMRLPGLQLVSRLGANAAGASPVVINPTPLGGYTPAQLRSVLGLSGDGRGQTIGITVAFDTPTIRADVARFSRYFGLPLPCDDSASPEGDRPGHGHHDRSDTANAGADCFPFEVAMPGGPTTVDTDWAVETALDVEWAHAIAPQAKILLVEAKNVDAPELFGAIEYAANHGASVISNSWLDDEFKGEKKYDHFCKLERAVCLFPTGDFGHEVTYPAVNPFAVAVGGTSLSFDSAGGVLAEVAWKGSGGGVSTLEPRPPYQADVNPLRRRAIPDVSYHADDRRAYAVFVGSGDYGYFGWSVTAGTSAGTPQWAAIIAVANQLRQEQGKRPFGAVGSARIHDALYSLQGRTSLFDVTSGSNGSCGAVCTAGAGYDTITGIGSPRHGIDTDLAAAP